jgi:ABC-2 type transport system ATP-binding protein
MDEGRIIVQGTPRELQERVIGKSRVEILCHNALPEGLPPGWPAEDAVHFSPGRCQLVAETEYPARAVVELVKWVDGCGAGLSDIHIKRPTLEDVFIELTGKTLRD